MTFHSPTMAQRRAELLEDMVAHVTAELVEMGITKDVAEQCGCALADHFAAHWGGQYVTFPKDHTHRLAERDMVIFHRLRGSNHDQLAREFGMSVRGIYKVISRVMKREIDHRQGKLDLPSAPVKETGQDPE